MCQPAPSSSRAACTRALATQAAGTPIVYLGASWPRTTGSALLVRAESDIASPADLRGRRIGLVDGSFHTAFLCTLLDRAGLALDEVERVDLPPAESRATLLSGDVDAWIAMDPHLRAVSADPALRVLQGCDGVIPNRSVFWAHRDILAVGERGVRALVEALEGAEAWIAADTGRAAGLFSRTIGRGVGAQDWDKALAGRRWGLDPDYQALLDEQQAEADLLVRHGVLPRPIRIADAALPSAPAIRG